VREVFQHTLRLQKVLEDANVKVASVLSDILGRSGRAMLDALVDGETDPERLADLAQGNARKKRAQLVEALRGRVTPHHRAMLKLHLQVIEALQAALRQVDASVGRFPDAGHLVSWAGLCPRNVESAGKRGSTRVRKRAPWLKATLVTAAWAAVRTKHTYLRAQFLRINSRRGAKKAILAVAASMLNACYFMLRDGVEYRDLGADHFSQHDKAKTIGRLVRRLQDLGCEVELKGHAA